MVHGLETMQRLNEEAIAKHAAVIPNEAELEAAQQEYSEWKRIALGFSVAFAAIVVMAMLSRVIDYYASPKPIPSVELMADAQVEPLYKYDDEVLIVQGFYRGQTGLVINWDDRTCMYSVVVLGHNKSIRVIMLNEQAMKLSDPVNLFGDPFSPPSDVFDEPPKPSLFRT